MGLDISYGSKARFLGHDEPDDWQNTVHVYDNIDFPGRADGLEEGYYAIESAGGFRAGSYSGYNRWREELSQRVLGVAPEQVWGSSAFVDRPFYELIHFSDCEGTIGPKTSAKLAQDFATHVDKLTPVGGDDWFCVKAHEWAKAFSVAADGGLVSFG